MSSFIYFRDSREMSNRQLVKLAFCICLLSLFFSCSSERDEGSEGSGTLHVQVNANPEVVVGTNTRVGDGTEQGVPDVNDFSFSIFKGETLRGKWATLADFFADDELTLRSGNYTAVASYSDVENEGFELPYFEGNQSFTISKGKTTNVKVTCYLANAKLKITYTDAFKEFFSSYSSEVTSSLNNIVKFEQSEERYGYFKPGELQVRTTFRKKQGSSQEVTVQAKTFLAEARHAYILTLDVDAGSSMVNISFSDDIPNQEPITIDVSDEALSAPAPYLKANGFGTEALSVVEGKSAESSQIYAYLNAAGGIAHCNLTTHSNTLIEQGWPESVDLANVPADILEKMQELGLKIVGLSDKKDKIAMIDFTDVISFLEYKEGDAEHLFTLNAVDIFSKTNEEPLTLKVNSLDNKFAITTGPTIAYGTTKVNVNMTLDGDPLKVNYWLKIGDSKQAITPKKINSDKEQHQLTFVLPESQTSVMQIEANYLRRMKSVESTVEAPLYTLSLAYPGDVWTKKATVQVDKSIEDGWEFLCFNDGKEINPVYSVDNTSVSMTGLPAGEKIDLRIVKKDLEGDIVAASDELEINTESELQLPNSNFEQWYEKFVWKSDKISGISNGNQEIYTAYPYLEGENEPWWATRNDLSTAESDDQSYFYRYHLSTTYVNSNHSASSKIGISNKPCNGEYSAEIAVVGWGAGSTCSKKNSPNCRKKTSGCLFIGQYDKQSGEQYGHIFSSRPTQMSFIYRFHSINGESASAVVKIEHREDDGSIVVLGEGMLELTSSMATPVDTQGIVGIEYKNIQLSPTHISVEFLASTASTPSVNGYSGSLGLFAGYGDTRAIGNILVIDDLVLEYAN